MLSFIAPGFAPTHLRAVCCFKGLESLRGGTCFGSCLGNATDRGLSELGDSSCPLKGLGKRLQGMGDMAGQPHAGPASSLLPAGFVVMDTRHMANP